MFVLLALYVLGTTQNLLLAGVVLAIGFYYKLYELQSEQQKTNKLLAELIKETKKHGR